MKSQFEADSNDDGITGMRAELGCNDGDVCPAVAGAVIDKASGVASRDNHKPTGSQRTSSTNEKR